MAINLTATNQSLELVTTAAVQTQVVVSARDRAAGADTPVSQDTNITTATTTTIEAAPAASTQRQTDDVEILIVGSGSQGVKVQKNVGGTVFALLNVLLNTSERAHFTNDMGWRLFDAFGREKGLTVGYSLIKAPTLLTSGTTYTPSIGCTALLIELWGGGGQGGGAPVNAANNASCGTGGNAPGYVRKFVQGIPTSITYAIGAAGSGAAAGAAGNAGGNTTMTINGVTYTSTGGPGGQILATGAVNGEVQPSAAVSGTNGDENDSGARGETGIRIQTGVAAATIMAIGGKGADSQLGVGGPAKGATAAGNAASGLAAGGSGACSLSGGAAQTGGAGTGGAIRVWEFTG